MKLSVKNRCCATLFAITGARADTYPSKINWHNAFLSASSSSPSSHTATHGWQTTDTHVTHTRHIPDTQTQTQSQTQTQTQTRNLQGFWKTKPSFVTKSVRLNRTELSIGGICSKSRDLAPRKGPRAWIWKNKGKSIVSYFSWCIFKVFEKMDLLFSPSRSD